MRDRIIDWLRENVSAQRLEHIIGVEDLCRKLALHHDLNPEQAAQAGLMHDLAKFFPPEKLLTIAHQNGLEIDAICQHQPHLLHADVSAIVAREQFQVTEPEILQAIADHTLGRPAMSHLSCIVFIADVLEPSRGENPELETMRQNSWQNLYKTVQQTCDYSLKYLLNNHKTIHPRTILTRNWALRVSKEQARAK